MAAEQQYLRTERARRDLADVVEGPRDAKVGSGPSSALRVAFLVLLSQACQQLYLNLQPDFCSFFITSIGQLFGPHGGLIRSSITITLNHYLNCV